MAQIALKQPELSLSQDQGKNCIFVKQIKYVSKDNEVLEFTGVTQTDNTMMLLISHHLLG